MSDKKEYLKKMKTQLDEWNFKWNVERNKIEAKAQRAKADLKKTYEEQIKEMGNLLDSAQRRMKEIQDSSEDTWEDLKVNTEKSWKKIKDSFSRIRQDQLEYCLLEWKQNEQTIQCYEGDGKIVSKTGELAEVVEILNTLAVEKWEIISCVGNGQRLVWTLQRVAD